MNIEMKNKHGSANSTPKGLLGYWAAQEQYSMHDLLEYTQEAERVGFETMMTSDHFHPWWHDNAFGNFTWVWMAAAAERTERMQFVTGITAPIYRYHPAIIAQAFASLDVLYPGRMGLGLGTGEALNEVPLGFDWTRPKTRLKRTKEAIQIIKSLWGENVSTGNNCSKDRDGFLDYNGEYFLIRKAKLYTPPGNRIPLYMASSGPESAKVAAKYSDGLITYLKPEEAKDALSAFDSEVKKQGRASEGLEKLAEFKVSFAEDYDRAFESTKFWRATLVKNVFNSDIGDPRKLEEKAKREVPDEKLAQAIKVTTSIEDCIKPLEEYFRAGFTRVYVHSTSPDEINFLHAFSKKVLPHFEKTDTSLEETKASAA